MRSTSADPPVTIPERAPRPGRDHGPRRAPGDLVSTEGRPRRWRPGQSFAPEPTFSDQRHRLVVNNGGNPRQSLHQCKDLVTTWQRSTYELSDNEVVALDLTSIERSRKCWIRATEVVDPHGRIDEHQRDRLERLRGAAFADFMVPPRAASRRALSRLISARKASWMTSVFARSPVSRPAWSINCSSRFSVVLICRPLCASNAYQKPEVAAGHHATGSDVRPRSVRLWRYCGRSVASASAGKRWTRALIAIWPSRRASGAPRQKWMPMPKAT
jgi:hypothetical protein